MRFFVVVLWLFSAPSFAADPLSSWTDGDAKRSIVSFVRSATTPGGQAFVEPADRVAVFDYDGTLAVEAPVYGQVAFCAWRLERLPPAPRAEALLRKVRALAAERLYELSDEDTVELWALGLAGPSAEQVQGDARIWLQDELHPRFGEPRTKLVYQPMLELIRWLKSRGFKVFMVTGSTVDFARAISEDLGVPRENVIGSSLRRRWSDERPSEVARESEFEGLTDKDRKVLEIDRRIGRRPLMAFGNSDGDLAMLAYATAGPRPGFGALVRHDDGLREYEYDRGSPVGALARGLELAPARGWKVISMKSDWKRLFRP